MSWIKIIEPDEADARLAKIYQRSAGAWLHALESEQFEPAFDEARRAALKYAVKLTTNPVEMHEADIESLQGHGWSDGEILEIDLIAAYFAYANRTVLGLGVTTARERLGERPGQ